MAAPGSLVKSIQVKCRHNSLNLIYVLAVSVLNGRIIIYNPSDGLMELTANELAGMVGGSVEGNGDVVLSSFGKIEDATSGSLTFLANPKYSHFIYTTNASAVLVSNSFRPERKINATLIRVPDPYATIAELLKFAESVKSKPTGIEQPVFIADGVEVPSDAYIGAFAYIGSGARLGKGVRIYPQVYIGPGVEIGDNTEIRAGVRIYEGCRIGKRCIIHSGTVIGADGFGFAPTPDGYDKIPQTGNVEISDDVEIGANCTVDRATFGSTRIGRGTKLDNLIQVAHNVEIGSHNVFASQTGIAGSTKIGDWNMVGGQVGFAGHIHVGSHNELGAQSGIHKNVGDHERLIGYPAVPVREFARNVVYISKLKTLFEKR